MANFPGSVSTNANLYIAVNGIQTTLAVSCTNSDTTLTLTSTTGFPTTGLVTIDNTEIVSYTGVSGATITGCVRGADGSTAASHPIGVTVGLTVVAAHHNLLKDEIIAVETVLGTTLVNAATSSAAASSLMVRDTNVNSKVNHVTENFATTVTAAGTTTLTVASARNQQFTGSTTQTVTLPDATTLSVGFQFAVWNRSSGAVAVNNNGGSLQQSIAAAAQFVFTCTNIGTANGTWDVSSAAGTGTVTSVSGTSNQITSTGGATPVLALPQQVTLSGSDPKVILNNTTSSDSPYIEGGIGGDGNLTLSGGSSRGVRVYNNSGGTLLIDAQGAGVAVRGSNTNDSAASGYIGEAVRSFVSVASLVSLVNTQWKDVTSISLTAGDWDVNGIVLIAGSTTTDWEMGISTTTGNSGAGMNEGDNSTEGPLPIAGSNMPGVIPSWRISLSTTTTVYLKAVANFASSTAQVYGRISARRMR